MQTVQGMVWLGLVVLFVGFIILLIKTSQLKDENKKLRKILEIKDKTIENFEASRVKVIDVVENFSSLDDVMRLINEGEDKIAVSEKLGIPLSKIELIIKFDKLKKK